MLVVAGVGWSLAAAVLALLDFVAFVASSGLVYPALGIGLVLLALGFWLIAGGPSADFPGALARRGMKTLAIGLLLDAGLIALVSAQPLHGSDVDVLILPLIVAGWTTLIGFAATVLSLLIATRRSLIVGLLFMVGLGAGYAAGVFTTTYERTDLDRALGIGLAIAAGCAVANPTAAPLSRASISSRASARSISTGVGTASSTRSVLAKGRFWLPAI